MEDLSYVKKYGTKATYTFVVDSAKRDISSYPHASEYVCEFNAPFRKVIGMRLLDAHVPKTENALTPATNTLVYKVGNNTKRTVTIPPGMYTVTSLLVALNAACVDGFTITAVNGKAVFSAPSDFFIYVNESSMTSILGIRPTIRTVSSIAGSYTSHGMIDVSGPRYIIVRCPEIETVIQHDRNFEKWNPGLGMVKFAGYGMSGDPEFIPYPPSIGDTPLARLSSITLRLEKPDGSLYDTGGLDHALVLEIQWLDPPSSAATEVHSILNPRYSANPLSSTTADEGSQQASSDQSDSKRDRYDTDFNWRHALGR